MFHTRVNLIDALTVLCVLLLAVLLLWAPWQSRENGSFLVVTTPDGDTEYALSQDRTVTVVQNGITLEIVIENGEAYVAQSDCPDGVCASSGRISVRGDTVICAPAGVKLSIKGGKGDVDHVAG